MLAIITSHFNFVGYNRPRQNLFRFVTQAKSFGYPLFGIEAYFKEQQPYTLGWSNWRQVMIEKDQIMFQKEALLNLLEKSIPPEFDKLAWIDADLWFSNLRWFEMTDTLLSSYKVLQLFETCYLMNKDGKVFRKFVPFVRDVINGHTGFAWAAQRELWKKHSGLYSKSIVGCGDDLSARAFVGERNIQPGSAGINLEEYRRWQQSVSKWVNGKYGVVSGEIYHEWHGAIANRAYAIRRDIIKDVDISKLTVKGKNKLLKWSKFASYDLKISVYNYFLNRKEDGLLQ